MRPLRPIHLNYNNSNRPASPIFQPLYSPTSLTRLEELDESSPADGRNSAFEGFTIKRKLSRKRKMSFSDTIPAVNPQPTFTTAPSTTRRSSLPSTAAPPPDPDSGHKKRRLDAPPKTTMTPAHTPPSPSTNSTISNIASARPKSTKSNTISKIPLRSKTTSHLSTLHRPNEARARNRNRISSAPAEYPKFEMCICMTEDVGRGAPGGAGPWLSMGGDSDDAKRRKRKRDADMERRY